MEERRLSFRFGSFPCEVRISSGLPRIADIAADARAPILAVCDGNTEGIARTILDGSPHPLLVLTPGEDRKAWPAVESIIAAAAAAGLGRDGLLLGIGGGVVTDMVSFAAAVYMRGCRLALVSTTLLGMADAALGGKTGFDLLGIKNLVGAFYPAERVYMGIGALASLPVGEWKSGMAEVIKTAILGDGVLFDLLSSRKEVLSSPRVVGAEDAAMDLVYRCAAVKGRIVEADPRETGTERALLNLGHTFGHALEAAAGLGTLTHGEAVAWGIARSCELGLLRGATPPSRARAILDLLDSYGYHTAAPHPAAPDAEALLAAMGSDKKKAAGVLRFVVPTANGACLLPVPTDDLGSIRNILIGAYRA